MAEAERLVRVYGYPKDNAFPPPLRERLAEPRFTQALRHSIADEEDASHLLTALQRLLDAVHG
ncbi:MAG: hypothetical protein CMH57_09785 [Myxococcales bacterium]|nr:hypothetical protein [Myxococcales bacterium]